MKKLRHEIPDDIFMDILLRLPVASILRFRVLSKSHRDLIDGPEFVWHYDLTIRRTRATQRYVLINTCEWRDDPYYWMEFEANNSVAKIDRGGLCPNLEDLPEEFLIGSCMGILCFWCESDPEFRILLWNPSTGHQRKVIPKLDDDFNYDSDDDDDDSDKLNFFVGYDKVTDDIKLLQSLNGKFRAEETHVYSSRSDSWKQIQGFKNQWPNLELYIVCLWSIFVEGTNCTHIPATDSGLFKVVAFDFSSERFGLVPLPNSSLFEEAPGNYLPPGLPASLGGCFCLYSSINTAPFEVWMMKEYGVGESWSKIFSLGFPKPFPHFIKLVKPVDLMNNGRQLLLWSAPFDEEEEKNKFCIYDDDDKILKNVTHVCSGQFSVQCYQVYVPFTPSIRVL